MRGFFEAKKTAVVGASRDRNKVGRIIFENLLANPNLKVFPINPKAFEISGVRCYPDVLSVPFLLDMAIIAVPAEKVLEVLEQCGKKNIKRVIMITAGFSEIGNTDLEKKVGKIARKYSIKIIGPNVLGIINPYKNLNASFFSGGLEKGNVGFISQSGAVATSFLDKCLESELGISSFISLGNMLQQDFLDAIEYLGRDRYTEIIVLYIESLKEGAGKRFVELCKDIGKKKKIIAIKAGKTEKGKEAAKTHTASLSSPSAIYSGAFKQAGIIETESIEELFFLTQIFSKYKNLGNKACIVTNAGGLGVLATDTLVKAGIELPKISDKTLKLLDSFLPKGYSRNNPLDILGDALAEDYEKVLKVLSRENFDFFVVIVSPQKMTQALETAKILVRIGKPVFACYIGGKSFVDSKKFLLENGMIVFDDVSKLKVLDKIVR